MRYIELNPVRANMVDHPGDYKWSSFHANGQGGSDSIVDQHPHADVATEFGVMLHRWLDDEAISTEPQNADVGAR